MSRRGPLFRAQLGALVVVLACAGTAHAAGCPTAPDPRALPDAAALKQMNAFLGPLGARPTGSPQQQAYITWIERQLHAIPGVQISKQTFSIDRFTEQSTKLRIRIDGRPRMLPVADAIPYSQPTAKAGVAAPTTLIPDDQAITAANAEGKVVIRPAPAGTVPMYDLFLPVVSWEVFDPKNTIDPSSNFEGDFINYNARTADMRAAAQAGAKAILFLKELPRRQLTGHYEPYEGTAWKVPGAFLGADEAKTITDAINGGHHVEARLIERARYKHVTTPSIEAMLPGGSPQRLVVDSHTDGTNAVEDNGPIAMVAMLRYFASLPLSCRPRTLQFAFSTAHFYQRVANPNERHGGAGQLAKQLDADYDKGTVSAVVVLEHLGAKDYEPAARSDGGAGQELKPTGMPAIDFIAITPSTSLVSAVDSVVRSNDLERTILLQGDDAPGATAPSHCNFGGEGTPYDDHLLPTIGVIAAPQFLYDPAIELEGIDFDVMHRELLAFTELINRMQPMSQAEIAGDVPLERQRRAAGAAQCNVDA